VVQTAVGASTDYLICGEKVGAVKMEKARSLGVTVLDEVAYRQMVAPIVKGQP
jgi:DNA ligase (NAD+)